MQRREFITIIGGTTIGWPFTVRAQQADRVRLIGVLMDYSDKDPASQSMVAAFRSTLAKLGWKEGRDLRIDVRWSSGNAERVKALAKELVDLRPDAILGRGTVETFALSSLTQTIPIVFAFVSDPIGSGFAASLAHPGGNVTGFTNVESTTGGKWVELLKELAPRTDRVALMFNPTTAPPLQFYLPSIQAAAASHAIQVTNAPIHAKDEIESVIAALARDPGGSLIVMPDTFNVSNRDLIVAMAARYGVPSVSPNRVFADSGLLISYGTDIAESFRQAAGYVDRILRGDRPGDLPIQRPAKFELVINMKTVKALHLKVPAPLLSTADDVIE
jgi:putative ABC transport system substrate-binding protein